MAIGSGEESRINTYTDDAQDGQQIAMLSDGGWVVTWRSNQQDSFNSGVYQQAYNADGTTRGAETQVNTFTFMDQLRPEITALSDGGWVVAWSSESQDGSGYGVYQQAYNADGTARGAETRVNTAPLTGSNRSVPGHLVPGSLASHQNPVCSKVVMPSAP